jgi:MFS family permease
MTGRPRSRRDPRSWLATLRQGLPATVLALGAASFFTDMSSEMIYPLIPAFLTDVLGAGALALGVVEGVAESTAAILKIASGWWTDRVERRKPFVVAGYGIAGAVRPMIAAATSWIWVVAVRFVDRIGKGVRTAPRDALITDVTEPRQRGAAFGVHRSLDHLGSAVGPLVAAGLLGLGLGLRTVFLLAVVPAVVVMIVLIRHVEEPTRRDPASASAGQSPPGDLGRGFWTLMAAVVLFTLGNSADAFLLLRLGDVGVGLVWIALLWSAFSIVKVVATWVGGRLSDRRGRKPLILSGWLVYGVIYLGLGAVDSLAAVVALFLLYGSYFGLTEPVERAWVADLAPEGKRGAAFGWYNGAVGIGALPANLIFGGIWATWGVAAAFTFGAAMAAVAAAVLMFVPDTRRRTAVVT